MDKELKKNYKGGKISEIVISSVMPFLNKLKKNGIKKILGEFLPGIDINNFVLEKIKNQLSKRRAVELGKGLGRVYIQYRFDGIQVEPCGVLRFLIKKITITDDQILKSFDDILDQIEEKYIKNSDYIISEIDDIIFNLSETEIYKPKTSEQKNLYDLAVFILANYYESFEEKPAWLTGAFENIKKGKFIKKWIEFLAEYISELISEVSENIFINFKVTFDSYLIRTFLNKKTNRGQISKMIKLFNIDVKKIIYNFAKSYVSPSFIRGASEVILEMFSNFLSDENSILEESANDENKPFNFTVSLGNDALSERRFRWYTKYLEKNSYLEYSYNKDFNNSIKLNVNPSKSLKLIPVLNFGLVSKFKVKQFFKYSCTIKNLNPGTLYYRVISENNDSTEVFKLKIKSFSNRSKFLILSDSQGMVKSDYDVFLEMLESAVKNTPDSDFIVHLGDFVDDGNNEEFWRWILDSKVWAENAVIPLSGNHEARVNALSYKNGIENSVLSHFNFMDFPNQNTDSGAYYSFVYNNITFIVLNTNMGREGTLDSRQYRWALNTAKKAKTPWKILLTHKTPYSNGPHHNDPDVKAIGKQIINLAYEGKIDLVFGGHDHVYVRTPMLAYDKKIFSEKTKNEEGKTVIKTYFNPEGTVFITPGTSGVKNYMQKFPVSFPYDAMIKLNGPVYSEVEVDDNVLKFSSFLWDKKSKNFKKIDFLSLKKCDLDLTHIDGFKVSRFINNIPDYPWRDISFSVNRVAKLYESLDYSEKVKINNYSYLLKSLKNNENYKKIIKSEIRTVKNKKEFIKALSNKKVGTIIADCEEIKFESKLVIDRPLCIRGEAKFTHVKFILQENAFVIFADSICIDNIRKPFSLCSSLDCFEMHSKSILILNDNVSVNTGYGIGFKGYGINIVGEKVGVYLNSSSYNITKNSFLHSSFYDSKVVVTSGKYFSLGKTPTINIDGYLKIKGGFIRNIKGSFNSNITIDGGIIGVKDKNECLIPLECTGCLSLESGKIRANSNGISVKTGKWQENNLKPPKSVEITGEIWYT